MNPRQTVGHHRPAARVLFRHARQGARRALPNCSTRSRWAGFARPLPGRTVRRPEAACLHCPRARGQAETDHLRRGDERARSAGRRRHPEAAARGCRQDEPAVAYLFITHDLATVRPSPIPIAVMYRGEVVRYGPKSQVLKPPFDAYTDLLLKSVPEMEIGWLEKAHRTARSRQAAKVPHHRQEPARRKSQAAPIRQKRPSTSQRPPGLRWANLMTKQAIARRLLRSFPARTGCRTTALQDSCARWLAIAASFPATRRSATEPDACPDRYRDAAR
jgi:hypothetical protein